MGDFLSVVTNDTMTTVQKNNYLRNLNTNDYTVDIDTDIPFTTTTYNKFRISGSGIDNYPAISFAQSLQFHGLSKGSFYCAGEDDTQRLINNLSTISNSLDKVYNDSVNGVKNPDTGFHILKGVQNGSSNIRLYHIKFDTPVYELGGSYSYSGGKARPIVIFYTGVSDIN